MTPEEIEQQAKDIHLKYREDNASFTEQDIVEILLKNQPTPTHKEVESELEDFVRWYWREVQGKPYSCTAEEIVNAYKT